MLDCFDDISEACENSHVKVGPPSSSSAPASTPTHALACGSDALPAHCRDLKQAGFIPRALVGIDENAPLPALRTVPGEGEGCWGGSGGGGVETKACRVIAAAAEEAANHFVYTYEYVRRKHMAEDSIRSDMRRRMEVCLTKGARRCSTP